MKWLKNFLWDRYDSFDKIAFIFVLSLFGLMGWAIHSSTTKSNDCKAKGGYVINSTFESLCVKLDVIK